MIAQELKDFFRDTLVAQRTIDQEFAVLDALVDFAAQNDTTGIPDWTGSLTFQLDGSDDGTFCTEPDTNGRLRFWKTKVNNNTNNSPPTDPLITENTYWIEVSPSDGSAVKEWAPGVYGAGLIIVYFDISGTGADPDLYVLAETVRPFNSTNFTTELTAGKWKRMQTVFDVAATGGTDVMNIGTTNADVINIGRVGATVNIYGNTIYSQVTNLEVSDKLIRLNRGGAAASAGGSGFELEENSVITGYVKTSSDRNSYELKVPNVAYKATFSFASLAADRSYTLPNNSGTLALLSDIGGGGSSWLLASGGTLTGVNTVTIPENSLNFTGSWTATGNDSYLIQFGGSITARVTATDFLHGYRFNVSLTGGSSNTQNLSAVTISPTLTGGADNTDRAAALYINPTFSGTFNQTFGIVSTQSSSSSVNGLRIMNSGTGAVFFDMVASSGASMGTASQFYIQRSNGTNGAVNLSNSGSGDIYISPNSAVKFTVKSGAATLSMESYGLLQSGLGIMRSDGGYMQLYHTSTGLGQITIGSTGSGGGVRIGTGAQAATWSPVLTVSPGPYTSMTAATEFVFNDFLGASEQWLAGTVANQRFTYLRGFTVTGASATATFTNAYTLYVDSPTAGTNATITNNWAAGFNGNVQVGDQLYLGNSSMAGATRAIGVLGSASDVGLQINTKGLGALTMYGNSVTIGAASYASGAVGVIRIQGNNSSGSGQAGSTIEILSGQGVAGNANSGNILLDLGAKAGSGKVGNIGLFSTSTDFDDAEKVLRIGARTAAPSGTIVADHAYLYVEDITAGNAAPHFMTEAGDIIKMYAISGWGTPSNTLTRTTFDTSTVTLQQLAERVGALISDLKTGHGLLKA